MEKRANFLRRRRCRGLCDGLRGLGALVVTAWISGGQPAHAQVSPRAVLSGYIRSASSYEAIRNAVIQVETAAARTESNQYGFYTLRLPAGTHRVLIRAVGYAPRRDTISLTSSRSLDFALAPRPIVLEELSVSGRSERPDVAPGSPDMSVTRLDLETTRLTPVVLGEVDPIRSLALLPGVSTGSDFSTGISVRGGSSDQNLILLDESTIYNPAHLFGFFSVFNADVIDDVTLYKGALPPRFGGRLSSVLDIHQREGNAREFAGSASLGLLASRATAEGPLPGRVGSFLVAGRRTYADLFLRLSSDPALNRNVAYFYDLNAKANVKLGANGAVMVSGYFGRDRFAITDRFEAGWGNAAGALRWNHAIGGRLFSRMSAAYSDYDYRLQFLANGPALTWTSRIKSLDLKVDESLFLDNRNTLEFGLQTTFYDFRPGTVRPVGNSPVVPTELQPRFGRAPALYLGHEVTLSPAVSLHYGVRLSGFRREGPAMIYRYANGQPVVYNALLGRYEPGTVVDSTRYGEGESVQAFWGLEPRISGRVALSANSSLKASYALTRQYLQLISNSNSPTPLDVWEPVGPHVRPQTGDQVALGYASVFAGERYEMTVEAYYKRLDQVTDFIDGADLTLNDRLETEIVQGTGRAYGLEVLARKRTGRLTGWVSYTLSRAEQRLGGVSPGDPGINGGRYYPAPYDKTHNVSVVGLYRMGRAWSFGGTFVLASGLPITYPASRYQYDGLLIAEYGPRNGNRLPTYHRMDVTFTRTGRRSQLQFGLFNLYNRFNAQSMTFRQSEGNALVAEAVQSSVFGLVPSVSFSFRF